MITLNDQIQASKEMLITQGIEPVEAEYFEKLTKGFTSKAVGLLFRHFEELLKLAKGVREEDSDKPAKYSATIKITFDVTDINLLNADYTLSYSRGNMKDTDGNREKVDEPSEKEESEDLGDLPTPGDGSSTPAEGPLADGAEQPAGDQKPEVDPSLRPADSPASAEEHHEDGTIIQASPASL